MARVGVVLSGCGFYDGAEINEAVLTRLALDEVGAEVAWLAPNIEQMHVIDHFRGDVAGEKRNVLVESARIARGEVTDIARVSAAEFDALVFPGGYGAAKNICDFAVKHQDCKVNVDVAKLVRAMSATKKPLGFVCIAPVIAAAVFRDMGVSGVRLTVGSDEFDAAGAIRKMGAVHVSCPVDETVIDSVHRVASTPAFMFDSARIYAIRAGIKKMVESVYSML